MRSCGNPSRGSYVSGCRCYMCRVANAEYSLKHSHRDGTEETPMVGKAKTAAARRKVEGWRKRGIGLREVEFWTGVPRSSLQTLVSGNHQNCNGLPHRMSRRNHDAIMATHIPEKAPGALVDSALTLRMIDELHERGMSYAEMARRSGIPKATVYAIERNRPRKVEQKTETRMRRVKCRRSRDA